jgi:hypothetical protein
MKNNDTKIIVWIMLALLSCCAMAVFVTIVLTAINLQVTFGRPIRSAPSVVSTPVLIRPSQSPANPEPTITNSPSQATGTQSPLPTPLVQATQTQPAVDEWIMETLTILENTIVPINDPIDLSRRLEGKTDLPVRIETAPRLLQTGERQTFWVINSDTNQHSQVPATLRYVTEHVYFWIQDGVTYKANELQNLVETFEDQIYPTNRAFFGSEWKPGVDNDPHLYILYTRGLGRNVAGYFSTADQYLPEVRKYSNGHEMFILSADRVNLGEEFAYSVLAHEFQHMIHWYLDRNEETWMNEGFSNLAAFLNGYYVGGHDIIYVRDPDMQLTDWPTDPRRRTAHYGAAFMFMTYFLDRFGAPATQAVVAHPDNGMVSLDKVLTGLGVTDPLTGQIIQADNVFADWVIATFLQDPSVGDGRYNYHNYPSAPKTSPTEQIRRCPVDNQQRDVSQYGVDYIRITCPENFTLRFEGATSVGVLPEEPYSGDYAFYSNQGDESHMTLTRTFDFSDHNGPLTLSYWTWYDLEQDYDYLYLTASLDGETWQILDIPSGTTDDPSGNSYGMAYNGLSGSSPEWILEQVDLSQYAGKSVQIRFEYVTDAAVTGEGFLVDDISIPEIGYFTDFENDDGGWQAGGFVRIRNILPQFFRLSLIRIGDNGATVTTILLPAENLTEIPIRIGNDDREVILVVSGLTRFTRQKALYQFSIQP